MKQHPIFTQFVPYIGPEKNNVDWIGMRYNPDWWPWEVTPVTPWLNEEYFEWIDLLEAVTISDATFTMLDLGAGFGRWGIRGALAARQRGIRNIHVRFVEAEPQHVAWMREALAINGLNDIRAEITQAAISYAGMPVPFTVATKDLDAHSWYGQAVVSAISESDPTDRQYWGNPVRRAYETDLIYVQPVTFEALTADLEFVDFVDMDLQGAEKELIEQAIDVFSAKVRLVHIGTHGIEIEDALRKNFRSQGWLPRWDFSLQGERGTPFGATQFQDGVQGWLNPRFASPPGSD